MKMIENENFIPKNENYMPIDKKIDGLLDKFEKEKEIRPTIEPTAKFYHNVLAVSGYTTCVAALAMLVAVVISVTTHKELNPEEFITISGVVTMTSMIVFIVFLIKRIFWRRKLRKLGLEVYIPLKYL